MSLAHLLKVAPLQCFVSNLSEVDITVEMPLVFLKCKENVAFLNHYTIRALTN